MKKALFLLLLIVLAPAKSRGEIELDKENLLWAGVSLFPLTWLHIVLHEGSHAIAAKALGAEVNAFHVWPETFEGSFYLGRTGTDWHPPATGQQATLFCLAPQMTNILLFSASEIIFASGALTHHSPAAALLFIFGELLPWADLTATIINSVDMTLLEQRTGFRPEVTRPIGAAISVVGAVFLAHRAYHVFFKKTRAPRKTKTPLRISMQSEAGINIAFDF